MSLCETCGAKTTLKLMPEYRTDAIGVPVVLIESAQVEVCDDCGEEQGIQIPDLPGLIAATAITRIKDSLKLNGTEIRFMRKALDLTAKELGRMLEVKEETVSRWENNKLPIGPTSEKLLRLAVGVLLDACAQAIDFEVEAIARMEIQSVRKHDRYPELKFRRVRVIIPHENKRDGHKYVEDIERIAA